MTPTNRLFLSMSLLLLLAGCGGGGSGSKHRLVEGEAPIGHVVIAGSLVEARVGHTATALRDGRVLIAGGRTLTARAARTAEVFDPRTGRTTPLPDAMRSSRTDHRAVALDDGSVLLVGGHDARGRPLATTELFDPRSGAFVAGPELLEPRDGAAVAQIGSHLFLAGGAGSRTVEALDLEAGTSVVVAELPGGPRRGARLIPVGPGLFFLGGGRTSSGAYARSVWIDLTGGALREVDGPLVEGGVPEVLAPSGEEPLLVVVGGTFRGKPNPELQVVSLDDDEPRFGAFRLHQWRTRQATLSTEQGVLVAGGLAYGFPLDSIEVVHPRFGTTTSARLAIPRYDLEATALAGGQVVLSGGVGGEDQPLAVIELLVAPGTEAPDASRVFDEARADRDETRAREALLARTQVELTRTRAELAAADAEVLRLEGELATARTELAFERGEVQRLDRELADALAELARVQADLTATRHDLAAARDAADQLRALAGVARDAIRQLEADRQRLEDELRQSRADAGRGRGASRRRRGRAGSAPGGSGAGSGGSGGAADLRQGAAVARGAGDVGDDRRPVRARGAPGPAVVCRLTVESHC